ncbi:MAG TPA: polysaccharide deacetylase family protein [Bryobacteraceae bacterium]|nr:polysaccharide deacetylase family protein [Bryobacteraceae bacterium]HOL71647.1 polysaccharide deacetylase family protein [Bryobacteraceae bacterium]HOQ45898.1 polysaccharide deacetylase family protein [Bryobacteraceae bacterium]HPQ15627.1 polysaccharide deacetylase family protein [Bryobacteraceae bacterium]HPU73283.1 polysaccharide deacetylase family protein [Bryobacteraceae bacterium]
MLKAFAREAFHSAGGLHLARALTRKGLRILMYHRFPGVRSRAILESCCAHIRKYYHPVSLTEVARSWREDMSLPPNALAVTVDDGYRDFYEFAEPVFASYGIPVTVYLVTDFLDGRCWLWADQIRYAFKHAGVKTAEIVFSPGNSIVVRLESLEEREWAAKAVREAAKRMPDEDRVRLIAELPRLLKTTIPEEPPPEYAPLAWESVREMAARGVEFGPHTRTHPILSRIGDDERLRDEIDGSRRRIEEETGRPAIHFCYPNGRCEDVGDRALERVRESSFQTGVVTVEGLNYPGCNLLMLKRIPADPTYPSRFFQEYLAGLRAGNGSVC